MRLFRKVILVVEAPPSPMRITSPARATEREAALGARGRLGMFSSSGL